MSSEPSSETGVPRRWRVGDLVNDDGWGYSFITEAFEDYLRIQPIYTDSRTHLALRSVPLTRWVNSFVGPITVRDGAK